jgi:hypothetical protein
MSKISLIYDAYLTLIQASLPAYARIANGLDPSNTPSVLLKKGYAFIPREGSNTERVICGNRSYLRTFEIILVNQITATENNYVAWDGLIKTIHEDVSTMFKEIEKSSTLNDITNGLGNTKMVSDSGIEYSQTAGGNKYFQISIVVETEYFESLT